MPRLTGCWPRRHRRWAARGLRCLVSYRALAALAENAREGQASHAEIQAIEAVPAKLRAPGN
jgi:hypothetical protein